ncbi:MAG: DNA methyltransferase [Acholeplasmataceae bacterium]|nr:DNA methyltransferase [Acholeplasmataceae bacterium]
MQEEKYTQQELFEFEERKTIKGYPELRWTGKRPYKSTQYYPAQLKEVYGTPDNNGWFNKIFWGDNLQVMSHLLKDYRGKIDLIYIDPPFDSKADYKKKIDIKGKTVFNTTSIFEEKQYGDIWTNDEYLQFMYERLMILRELLNDKGSIFLHCDWHKSHHLRMLLDEIFGPNNFVNEIIWHYDQGARGKDRFGKKHDNIFWYSKTEEFTFNSDEILVPFASKMTEWRYTKGGQAGKEMPKGKIPTDVWDIKINSMSNEHLGYPTQKPEELLERIIKSTSNLGDLVFDCFMGSGTAQAVALKMGRRFIGADINLGAVQTTSMRLNATLKDNNLLYSEKTGFEVYTVNNYDFFRNPLEARELLIEALGIQPFSQRKVFDGELDGRNVKIMPVNRIATKADLKELIANLPYTVYDKKKEDSPNSPVDHITLVCMGHEPDLTAAFKQEISAYKIDVEIVDILTDKKDFEFKREAQAEIKLINKELLIESFYPMNLMQKLSLQKEHVDNYKQLVESIMIDWNYDGQTLKPTVIDIPDKNEYVKGKYPIPAKHGKIKIKITDLLSESLEVEVN